MIFVNNFSRCSLAVMKSASEAGEAAADVIHAAIKEKVNTRSNTPSRPGRPPHRRTGRLYSGIAKPVKESEFDYVVGFESPASHAHFLIYGTPYMAPRPFVEPAFRESAPLAEAAAWKKFQTGLASKAPLYGGSIL